VRIIIKPYPTNLDEQSPLTNASQLAQGKLKNDQHPVNANEILDCCRQSTRTKDGFCFWRDPDRTAFLDLMTMYVDL
jgi:hypothetical protein